jgi:uncharacterized membrane protein
MGLFPTSRNSFEGFFFRRNLTARSEVMMVKMVGTNKSEVMMMVNIILYFYHTEENENDAGSDDGSMK